jgi:hypothetical protein
MSEKVYKLNIDPRILELLGPNLYTNIYYILAELIANAYDADAANVYIIANKDDITVEDDGDGMSYEEGDVNRYLNVASVSRTNEDESLTKSGNRKRMGRKGVGKLAALSVSKDVIVKTIKGGEKSGFILSRNISSDDKNLIALNDSDITFEKIQEHGTSIVMKEPQYRLHSTLSAVKRNLVKMFPLVSESFRIHIIRGDEEVIISDFDKTMIGELSTIITIGEDFKQLVEFFQPLFSEHINELCVSKPTKKIPIELYDNEGSRHEYFLSIDGWIGTFKSTRGKKVEMTDFPDNFLSLYSNQKLGEFNILPVVGQNKLAEVYVVGQLHIDLFELTELPDMALSNRQGYKTDDPRYQEVLKYVRTELLPDILKMRDTYASLTKRKKDTKIINERKADEEKLRQSVDKFRGTTSRVASERIARELGGLDNEKTAEIERILTDEINNNSSELGLKRIVDSQKKRILISQTRNDKDLSDIVYNMLVYNDVLPESILYTNCDDELSRIPIGYGVYDYLRDFFVDSYSAQKMVALFITSSNTKASWGALIEVGAAWITQIEHKIFNISGFRPEHPLDDEQQWHSSHRDSSTNSLYMDRLDADIFCQNIEYVCRELGYSCQTRKDNMTFLETLIKII